MKSYSNFIIEKKKGQTVASPAPGDPLDPKGRKKIDKKFSDPSNPPKVANPEAPKPKPAPKPQAVNQADVSKQAAKYRRAERIKGATGGKTTGSLSRGTLSFPGDRSGAYQKTKSDLEARKGFSDSKSGGLKADETSRYVDRSVRQQRAAKQGIPDPFKSKTPAPADPFKGVIKAKPGTFKPRKLSMPDPFKGSASVPPKPKKPGAPERPAMRQAISDIKAVRKRLGVTKSSTGTSIPSKPKPSIPKPPKTVEQTPVNKYFRTMQDQGRPVDPDLVGPQGLKASGAKPEMVGGSTAPTGTGTRMRAKGDAIRDISKTKNADLDKALRNLVNSGDVKKSKPSGPSTSIGFRQASKKFSELTKQTKASQARSAAAGYSQSNKPKPGSEVVKAPTKPTGVGGPSSKPGDITLKGPSKSKPSFPASKGSALAKKSFGQFSVDSGRGRGGALSKVDDVIDVKVKDLGPKKTDTPRLSGGAAAVKAQNKSTKTILKSIGKGAARAAGVAATGLDAFLNYRKYRNRGDSRLTSGLKSAFRTSLGWLGGAAGSALGSVAGPVGTVGGGIAGYSGGTWLADKVLGDTKKKRETAKK